MDTSQVPKASGTDNIDWALVEKFIPGATSEEQRTKFHIFFAAARLFARKGYDGTAVREIVEDAGVTKPTLYYYFTNKEDLYVKLIDMAMATFLQILNQALAKPGAPRERLTTFFHEVFLLFQNNVDLLHLVNLMIYAPRGAVPAYDLSPWNERLLSGLNEMLRSPVEEGPEMSEESRKTALLLVLGLLRSIQIHLVMPEIGPLTLPQIDRVIAAILEGVRAQLPEIKV